MQQVSTQQYSRSSLKVWPAQNLIFRKPSFRLKSLLVEENSWKVTSSFVSPQVWERIVYLGILLEENSSSSRVLALISRMLKLIVEKEEPLRWEDKFGRWSCTTNTFYCGSTIYEVWKWDGEDEALHESICKLSGVGCAMAGSHWLGRSCIAAGAVFQTEPILTITSGYA